MNRHATRGTRRRVLVAAAVIGTAAVTLLVGAASPTYAATPSPGTSTPTAQLRSGTSSPGLGASPAVTGPEEILCPNTAVGYLPGPVDFIGVGFVECNWKVNEIAVEVQVFHNGIKVDDKFKQFWDTDSARLQTDDHRLCNGGTYTVRMTSTVYFPRGYFPAIDDAFADSGVYTLPPC